MAIISYYCQKHNLFSCFFTGKSKTAESHKQPRTVKVSYQSGLKPGWVNWISGSNGLPFLQVMCMVSYSMGQVQKSIQDILCEFKEELVL